MELCKMKTEISMISSVRRQETIWKQKKQEHFHNFYESMQKGYIEMARINLKIASEAFQAEEEAEVTLERTVIGV